MEPERSRTVDYDMPTSVTRPWDPIVEPGHSERELHASHRAKRERQEDHDVAHRTKGSHADPFVLRVIKRYLGANGPTYAVNIAWNTLFAFFPIILLITTVLTLIFGDSSIATSVDASIQGAVPGNQGKEIVQALHDFHAAAGPLFVVSIIGLAWSGSALFSALDQGLNALYPEKQRSFIRQKLLGVLMILVFAGLVALDVGSASLLSLVTGASGAPSFLRSGAVATLIQVAFGIFDGLLLFGAIFYVVPNRPQRLSEVIPGALVAAVLFEAFTLLFPLFFKLQHGFSTYGQTFALFFLLLTFAFWVAQIIMFGAAVNAERTVKLQDSAEPQSAAREAHPEAHQASASTAG